MLESFDYLHCTVPMHCSFYHSRILGMTYLFPQMCSSKHCFASLLRDKMEIFEANGFGFKEDEDGQLLLTAVPFSKDTVFGLQDVQVLQPFLHSDPVPICYPSVGTRSKNCCLVLSRSGLSISPRLLAKDSCRSRYERRA